MQNNYYYEIVLLCKTVLIRLVIMLKNIKLYKKCSRSRYNLLESTQFKIKKIIRNYICIGSSCAKLTVLGRRANITQTIRDLTTIFVGENIGTDRFSTSNRQRVSYIKNKLSSYCI